MWRTVQQRLPFWLYKHGINTMEEANKHLPEFIKYYNKHFAKKAKSETVFWRPPCDGLDDILCVQIPRHTDSNGCFSFHAYKFCLINAPYSARRDITLCISERGFMARLGDKYYNVRFYDDDNYITDIVADNIPIVVKEIMYKYLYEDQKEVSA